MFEGTTIVAVRRGSHVVLAGDGQVSMGATIVKAHANKLRSLAEGSCVAGFAGSTADALLLFEMFERKLKEHSGQFVRAAVEMAKEWRSDKILRRLEALMLVANADRTLLLSGSGDVIEPDTHVYAIGSGGPYALAAARALFDNTSLDARDIARKALSIASEICVYTNHHVTLQELNPSAKGLPDK